MGRYYAYLTRTIPAWSVIGVVVLLVFSFVVAPYGKAERGERLGTTTTSQRILMGYTLILHILSVMFSARLVRAMGDVTKRMKEAGSIPDNRNIWTKQIVKNKSGTNTYPVPLFVIIIPAYKEEMATLDETLRVLASHAQARQAYHVYLAMEQKEEKADVKAAELIKTFGKSFYKISYTVHPSGIPGEAQGKSSNESWAAKQACQAYPDEMKKNIIMTVMDADTHLSTRYFAQVATYHVESPTTNQKTIYVPPLVFDRNLHQVPLPVRTADLLWAGAGLSSLTQGSSICIPTSVYSLPMTLVELVGGWDTDPGAIGEDMHMYLKCFFALSGNLTSRIVYAASSQCNVSSDSKGFYGYVDSLRARYRQALRHMWGSMDTGYAVRQTLEMITRQSKQNLPATKELVNGTAGKVYASGDISSARSTSSLSKSAAGCADARIQKSVVSKPAGSESTSSDPIHMSNVLTLFHRLFEAHFLPIHLSLILATSGIYDLIIGSLRPRELALVFDFCTFCRFVGWALMCVYFFRYERYHQVCVRIRQDEMRKTGMLSEVSDHDGFSHTVFRSSRILEAGIFPLGGFLFGAIPACEAVIRHLFTDQLTYHVSLKPQFIQRWRGKSLSSPQATPPPPQVKASPLKPPQQKPSHTRYPSDTWRKQAISHFEHMTTAMSFNRPVKRKD